MVLTDDTLPAAMAGGILGPSPDQFYRIALEVLIPCTDWHLLNHSLTDDQAIERVTVMEWQCNERGKVLRVKG